MSYAFDPTDETHMIVPEGMNVAAWTVEHVAFFISCLKVEHADKLAAKFRQAKIDGAMLLSYKTAVPLDLNRDFGITSIGAATYILSFIEKLPSAVVEIENIEVKEDDAEVPPVADDLDDLDPFGALGDAPEFIRRSKAQMAGRMAGIAKQVQMLEARHRACTTDWEPIAGAGAGFAKLTDKQRNRLFQAGQFAPPSAPKQLTMPKLVVCMPEEDDVSTQAICHHGSVVIAL